MTPPVSAPGSPPRDHPLARLFPKDAGRVLVVDAAWPGGDAALGPEVPDGYDAIVLDGVLAKAPDPAALLTRAGAMLAGERSRLLLTDEVRDPREIRRRAGGHPIRALEAAIHDAGFFVWKHEPADAVVPVTAGDLPWPPAATEGASPFAGGNDGGAAAGDAAPAGRETWVLRPGLPIRNYRPGDEDRIVPLFEEVFAAARSAGHWRWKFADSPYGGPNVSCAWDGDELVAHYGGYVVPFWMDGRIVPAMHVGDTMIRASHRGFGRGRTSLLAQLVRHFTAQWCTGQAAFGYGFSTGTHLKLGQMFLGYDTPVEVTVRTLDGDALAALAATGRADAWRRGFTVRRTRRAGAWADLVWRRARFSLGWHVARTREYLRWRYERDPDHEHEFFVVSQWGVPCGWWLVRRSGNTIEMGDAMFRSRSRGAARAGMAAVLRAYRSEGVDVERVTGWMSAVPEWWNRELDKAGFRQEREATWMELIVKATAGGIETGPFDRNYYYTQGDGDMF